MDLYATTPETEWAGIWHLFPAIKMVRDFPTGKYSRWMANGQSWWALRWLMGNYTPTVYIDLHEDYYWFPNDLWKQIRTTRKLVLIFEFLRA